MPVLTGRIALVVGGAGAVGAAVCRRLVQRGCRVLIADGCARVAAGTRLAEALGACAQFELLDPTDEREWASTINDGLGRFGGLDTVVLVEPDPAGVALAVRSAGPYLAQRGGALVGLAREQAAAALSAAGIPVVTLPDTPLTDAQQNAVAEQALEFVEHELAAAGASARR